MLWPPMESLLEAETTQFQRQDMLIVSIGPLEILSTQKTFWVQAQSPWVLTLSHARWGLFLN